MIAKADPELDRLPRMDLNAEMSVLGAMALCGDDRATFRATRRLLWPLAFYDIDHQLIFRVLCEADDAGKPIDTLLLRSELERRKDLETIGGTVALARIIDSVPSPAHGPHYAAIVAGHARAREAIAAVNAMTVALMEPSRLAPDVNETIGIAANRLASICATGQEMKAWTISEAVDRFMNNRQNGQCVTAQQVGIEDLDRDYLGMFRFGGYTLVAARPSMGKSTLIRWMLTKLAISGTTCGLIAIEENETKIAGNVLSHISEIENDHIAYGKWTAPQQQTIRTAAGSLASAPLYCVDTAFSLSDVLSAAEMMIGQHGCKVVAVDHLHLIDGVRAETRQEEISKISGALKNLWKRRNVVGIVAAQLNRPEKGQCPPPPQLTDLRGSGALEEHADAVLMLHRKDYYFRGSENYTPDGLAQLLIRKNRNGAVGEVVMKAQLQFQRFAPLANGHEFD